MKPLTPEEEALLIKLQQHKEEYRIETVHCVNTIWAHITDDEGNLQADKMVANAKQIRLLLEPYDEALVEFVPPSVDGVRVVDVTTLHGTRALNWLRGEEAPNHLAAGCARITGRLKRMGPETGNVGYWFVDPSAYSVGPFRSVGEREIYIRRMFIEPPMAPAPPTGF